MQRRSGIESSRNNFGRFMEWERILAVTTGIKALHFRSISMVGKGSRRYAPLGAIDSIQRHDPMPYNPFILLSLDWDREELI